MFAESIESELCDGGEFCNMTDWAGKVPGQAICIAGVFHLIKSSNPVSEPIPPSTMSMALNLTAILTEHAQIAFGQMGADPAVECARKILKWIIDKCLEQFPARDAFNAVKGDQRFSKKESVLPGLNALE
jgi:hypothetical protein